jgi:hypothetical protein
MKIVFGFSACLDEWELIWSLSITEFYSTRESKICLIKFDCLT